MSANQRINKDLCSSNSSSPAHILRVIEKSSHQFNIINASTAFSRLAKTHLRVSTAAGHEEETLRTLLKRCKNLLRSNTNQLEPRHLSSILWAVGKMRLIRVDGLGRRDGACFGNDCEFGAREKEEHRVRSARDFEFVLGIGEDLW